MTGILLAGLLYWGFIYLGYPDGDCQGIDKEVASCEIIPGHRLAIHDKPPAGAVLANEANMKVDKELHEEEKSWAVAEAHSN